MIRRTSVMKSALILCAAILAGCDNGSSNSGSSGSAEPVEPVEAQIEPFAFMPPEKITEGRIVNSQLKYFDYEPTFTVEVALVNNASINDLDFYEVEVGISAEITAEGETTDYVITLPREGSAYRALPYGRDSQDIYHGASNMRGDLRFLFSDFQVLRNMERLASGGFKYFVKVRYFNGDGEIVSEDAFPDGGVYTTELGLQMDEERDYLGESDMADIRTVNVVLNF